MIEAPGSQVASLGGPSRARLTCGVALCTHNGRPYLSEQFDSMLAQSRCLEQIVISDDASSDGTWELATEWARYVEEEYRISVVLFRNAQAIGVAKNFEQAVRALETDLIFLCDQDDVWTGDKVEVLAAVFEAQPELFLVHTDARLIDRHGVTLQGSIFKALWLSDRERSFMQQRKFVNIFVRRNLVTGATAAIRRELLKVALPIPEPWIHDEWFAACAAAHDAICSLSLQLTWYRVHGSNVIGVPVSSMSRVILAFERMRRMARSEHLEYKLQRLIAFKTMLANVPGRTREKVALLDEAIEHFQRRLRFGRWRIGRIIPVLQEYVTGAYGRFSEGVLAATRDLLQK